MSRLVFLKSEGNYMELTLWLNSHNSGLPDATPDDIRRMGLVPQLEVNRLLQDVILKLCGQDALNAKQETEPSKEPQPTRRFKVGDKVRVVGNIGIQHHALGEETEIIELRDSYYGYRGNEFIYRVEYHTQCIVESDLELIEAAPAPHVWQVGQYVLCPDGKVRRITKLASKTFLNFHDKTYKYRLQCTPCAEPEMPELPTGYSMGDSGNIKFAGGLYMPLESYLVARNCIGYADHDRLTALRDWRELTGRMV